MKRATLQDYGDRPRNELERRIADMGPWFHNLHLPDGTQTAPHHPLGDFPRFKWEAIASSFPEDLAGWSALDIGCNAGFYSFALAERGADVLGIDVDAHYLRQASWALSQLNLRGTVRFEERHVYDLFGVGEQFDIVLFQGVFYHLRYPLVGLDLAASKVKRLLLFQSLSTPGKGRGKIPADLDIHDRERMLSPDWPKMSFVEHALAGDPTNWWVPNLAAVEAMLRSAGLTILNRPTDETYLCAPRGPRDQRDEWLKAARDSFSRPNRILP